MMNSTKLKLVCLFYVLSFHILCAQVEDFSFVFYTDVHLNADSVARQGLEKTVAKINALKPDFVVDGGDFLFDMNHKTYQDIEDDYSFYQDQTNKIESPLYKVIGNHDVLGVSNKYKTKVSPKFQGEALFKKDNRGVLYSTFRHKGWQFFLLDCVQLSDSVMVDYFIDNEQLKWFANCLDTIPKQVPIVLFSHVPFMSASAMYKSGPLARNSKAKVFRNSHDLIKLTKQHQLKLTISGHLHQYEHIMVNNKQFVNSPAVCGFWWRKERASFPRGFLRVSIIDGEAIVDMIENSGY